MQSDDQSLDQITCPKCGSNQCHAGARGWTPQRGMLGMGKVLITCLKCGFVFPPGCKPVRSSLSASAQRIAVAVMLVVIVLVFWMMNSLNS